MFDINKLHSANPNYFLPGKGETVPPQEGQRGYEALAEQFLLVEQDLSLEHIRLNHHIAFQGVTYEAVFFCFGKKVVQYGLNRLVMQSDHRPKYDAGRLQSIRSFFKIRSAGNAKIGDGNF